MFYYKYFKFYIPEVAQNEVQNIKSQYIKLYKIIVLFLLWKFYYIL